MSTDAIAATARPRRTPLIFQLYVQVLIGIALGVALGFFAPDIGVAAKPLGDAQLAAYRERGVLFPLPALDPSQLAAARSALARIESLLQAAPAAAAAVRPAPTAKSVPAGAQAPRPERGDRP